MGKMNARRQRRRFRNDVDDDGPTTNEHTDVVVVGIVVVAAVGNQQRCSLHWKRKLCRNAGASKTFEFYMSRLFNWLPSTFFLEFGKSNITIPDLLGMVFIDSFAFRAIEKYTNDLKGNAENGPNRRFIFFLHSFVMLAKTPKSILFQFTN